MKVSLFAGKLALCLLLAACTSKKKNDFTDHKYITGIASVAKLSGDSTLVNLEDYVLDISLIDSISTPQSLSKKIDGKQLILKGILAEKIGTLQLWIKGQAYSIPLQQTFQVPVTFSYDKEANSVAIKGEFNAWNASQTSMLKNGASFTKHLLLNPGRYQYLLVVDGKEKRDPSNKDSVDNGSGGWNSVIQLAKPDPSKLPLMETTSFSEETVELSLSNPADQVTVYWQNFLLDDYKQSATSIRIRIPKEAKNETRSYLRAWAANSEGIGNDVLIPLHQGKVLSDPSLLTRQDKEAQVLYFMMVDRFHNGKPENDEPVKDKSIHPKANFYGGDLVGITAKIKEGYFSQLGVNTLWLSPITQNPKGAYGKYPTPATTFSAYHGYWPVSLKQLDDRFGNKKELDDLLAVAHANNLNVILDYVAHHVHQEHPLYKQNPKWFTPLYLPDGSINTERWDDQRLTTWFDLFLPTLDLRRPEVVGPMTDTAMFWLEEFDLDGFRHDASKHIDLLFWRELTKKTKSRIVIPQNKSIYQIGETYGSRELVSSYVNSGMLDGQFDFNLYDDAVATFAREEVPFTRLINSSSESFDYFGNHHLMGNITGNQDRARFISYADGSVKFNEDAKLAGWTRNITVTDTLAYKKLQLLTAYMMISPGVPVVYYGDEIGDAGGNDPDNRRMMRFDNLSSWENATRMAAASFISLRKKHLALVYGDWKVLYQTTNQVIIRRKYFEDVVIVAFNKDKNLASIDLEKNQLLKKEISGIMQGNSITLQPLSVQVFTSDKQ